MLAAISDSAQSNRDRAHSMMGVPAALALLVHRHAEYLIIRQQENPFSKHQCAGFGGCTVGAPAGRTLEIPRKGHSYCPLPGRWLVDAACTRRFLPLGKPDGLATVAPKNFILAVCRSTQLQSNWPDESTRHRHVPVAALSPKVIPLAM